MRSTVFVALIYGFDGLKYGGGGADPRFGLTNPQAGFLAPGDGSKYCGVPKIGGRRRSLRFRFDKTDGSHLRRFGARLVASAHHQKQPRLAVDKLEIVVGQRRCGADDLLDGLLEFMPRQF